MGASGWAYFAPYQSDINKALQELREAVFRSGAYYTEAAFLDMINEDEVVTMLPPDFVDTFKNALNSLRSQPPASSPTSIEELLELNGESGTHSIIDINGISSEPDFGMVAPLSDQQLTELFNTSKPTRNMVEEKGDEVLELRKRWEGTYILVYKDGLPDEIYFAGYSGD